MVVICDNGLCHVGERNLVLLFGYFLPGSLLKFTPGLNRGWDDTVVLNMMPLSKTKYILDDKRSEDIPKKKRSAFG